MKQIVPWRDDRDYDDHRMDSVLVGVPSLAIGLGGIILLLSLLVGKPIGGLLFYDVERVPVVSKDAMGRTFEETPAKYMLPSIMLIVALCVGAFLGGMGIYLSRADKKIRPVRTSASGLIACSMALALSRLFCARAVF